MVTSRLNQAFLFTVVAISLIHVARPFSTVSFIGTKLTQRVTPVVLHLSKTSETESSLQEKADAKGNTLVKTLDDALKYDTTSASYLLGEMQMIRSEGGTQEEVDIFLDTLLSFVYDNGDVPIRLPFWTKFRSLARFSSRARRASLRRVIELSAPYNEETDENDDEIGEEASKRNKRRSLVVLLRTLSSPEEKDEEGRKASAKKNRSRIPSICTIEKLAIHESKESVNYDDMATRLPPGLETPEYTVVSRCSSAKNKKASSYEIRKYEAFSVCSVPMRKPRPADATKTDAKISNPQLSGATSFGALAGYLFGKNSASTAMKMTTPVLTRGDGEDQTMSFVMPSDYWEEGSESLAPQPLEGSGVRLERDNGGYRAAIMFGGYASKSEVSRRKMQLLENLEKDEEFVIVNGSPICLAQYNDPFTPPWKRRNEVFVPVVPRN